MNELPQKLNGTIKKKFDCGCEWEVQMQDGNIIGINYEPEKAPLNCPKVWQLICSGNTKGIFQLETPLGQITSKACQPYGVEELSDVMSILRPGCGDAELDGKTLKQRYIDRKNGREEPTPPHQALEEVLRDTYGIFVTQEQAMLASQIVAGFTGEQANKLRKAAGKKRADLMAKMKDEFINGAIKLGRISEEDAHTIFDILEASQRYSFNKSHSVSYALNAIYFSAYQKSHFPRAFFLSELTFAECIEDIGEVLNDALTFKVSVCKPDLRVKNADFMLKDGCIYYGIGKIKGFGPSKLEKLMEHLPEDLNDWNGMLWALSNTPSDAAAALVYSGAMDFTLLTRNKMMFDLSIMNRLTERQRLFVKDYKGSIYNAIIDMITGGSGKGKLCANAPGLVKLDTIANEALNPPMSLRDSSNQLFDWEIKYLGYAFTTSEIDEGLSNCTCEDFINGKELKEFSIAGSVVRIKPILTKGKEPGQKMAFVEFKDSTNKVSGVAFPKVWEEYASKLYDGNKLMFFGSRGKDSKRDSFVINKVMQL